MPMHFPGPFAQLLPLMFLLFPAAPSAAADGSSLSGAEVYAQSCAMCHSKGVAGAPRPREPDDWQARMVPGRADLLRSVLRGKGGMPPKGGNASLSAIEANAALDYMLPHRARR